MGSAKKKPVAQETTTVQVPECKYEDLLFGAVHPGRNIRKEFDDEKHQTLVENIKVNGILEPLLVMHSDKSGEFEIIAGERRYRAAKTIGLTKLPCKVYPPLSEAQLYDIMITENLLRADLNAIEEAEGIQKLLDLGVTQEELGKKMGKSQEWISNRIRLLETDPKIKQMIISREINPGHAFLLMKYSEYPFHTHYLDWFKKKNQDKIAKDGSSYTVREITDSLIVSFFSVYS